MGHRLLAISIQSEDRNNWNSGITVIGSGAME